METLQKFANAHVIISLSVIVAAIIIKIITRQMLRRLSRNLKVSIYHKSIVSRIIDVGLFLTVAIVLLGIWEIDPDDLALYLASIFTIIGLAFFHQRSHLSNITAAVILFFNHPVKVGDRISIHDRDQNFHGQIEDIGIFFVSILSEDDEKIIVSNTQFLQKVVSLK